MAIKQKMEKENLKKWYDEHRTRNSVAYSTWWVRVKEWKTYEQALIKKEKKPHIITRNLQAKENKEMLLEKTRNIVSTIEEFRVILNAYKKQISEYNIDDLEEEKKRDNLISEMNRFIEAEGGLLKMRGGSIEYENWNSYGCE